MGFRLVFLTSDILFFITLILIIYIVHRSQKKTLVRQAYQRLFERKIAMVTFVILSMFTSIAILDSVHFQKLLPANHANHTRQYAAKVYSVFDVLMGVRSQKYEITYSSPFALRQYVKESKPGGGQFYPRLKHIDKSVKTIAERNTVIMKETGRSFVIALMLLTISLAFYFFFFSFKYRHSREKKRFYSIFYITYTFILLFIVVELDLLSTDFHVLGTGKVGQDIFFFTLKSIRTGILIGLLTTFVMLPFALILGISAGYFGKRVDDAIQYLYITISSVPGVLLIAASVLSMQVFIVNHPSFFRTLSERADARLIALCVILGLTSWTGLCRMLRAESLKIREIDYIQAGIALGSSNRFIIFKHILPNVMHLIVIAVVLDFSFLVLAEAVLSYIGVGVSPLTISWGNMINGARLELAREPIVWWPMTAAFIFMFLLVLAANLFADALRDVFDPRGT